MAKDALLKIIEAEEQADNLVKKANDDAKNMIILAENISKTKLEEAISSAKKECDRLKEQAQEDIKPELDSIFKASEEKCKKIVDIPKEKFDNAKKILIERIVK